MTRSLLRRGVDGMSRDAVIEVLGQPDMVNHFIGQGRASGGAEEMDYELGYNAQLSADDVLALYLDRAGTVVGWTIGSG